MGLKGVRRVRAMRRIWESVIASVTGGLILWSMTSSLSQPAAATGKLSATAVPLVQPTATPPTPSLLASTIVEAPPPRLGATLSIPASTAERTVAAPSPRIDPIPYTFPIGRILLYEDFSHYREGAATDWGANTFIKSGLDHRNWIVSNVDGAHPVGYKIRLPSEFSFECRYSAFLPEVTRGVFGWWKEPVATKISFLGDQGARYSIGWTVRYGNDPTRLNPLGSSSLYAKKHYHTFKLPDGTTNEVGVAQPTGVLRIQRENNTLKVFLDGQPTVVGTMSALGQLDGFEIDVVRATSGTLFFTDFKIAR
jgi:hypothetical protein